MVGYLIEVSKEIQRGSFLTQIYTYLYYLTLQNKLLIMQKPNGVFVYILTFYHLLENELGMSSRENLLLYIYLNFIYISYYILYI